MLKIKLTRVGKKNQPAYRIVVNERRDKRDGKYLEQVGFYNPITKEVRFDDNLYQAWIEKGAQPTLTVANLYKKFSGENQKKSAK
jgi:small subunit ribosomal protein S16